MKEQEQPENPYEYVRQLSDLDRARRLRERDRPHQPDPRTDSPAA